MQFRFTAAVLYPKPATIISILALILAILTLFEGGFLRHGDGLLQKYSDSARHWSTANYYSGSRGGYQASAAAWTRKAFY